MILNLKNPKIIPIASLSLAILLLAGTAVASMTFNTTDIVSDGGINLNPTTDPVTVNGDLTVTGTCTGCGGGSGSPGGADTSIQFNDSGSFGGFGSWDGEQVKLTSLSDSSALYTHATSDGYAEGSFGVKFIASMGDVSPGSGLTISPGVTGAIGLLYNYYNDTTDEDSTNGGIILYGNSAQHEILGYNAVGDVALGEVHTNYGSSPIGVSNANLFIPADGSSAMFRSGTDYATVSVVSTSDGYAGAEFNVKMVAKMGDVYPESGDPTTPGDVVPLADWTVEYNDPTNALSLDTYLHLSGHGSVLSVNAIGDVAIGEVSAVYSSYPVNNSDANLFIDGATGNVILKGNLQVGAVNTSAPAGGDCDAAGETGKVYWDSTNDNLYICSGASGWRKITTSSP